MEKQDGVVNIAAQDSNKQTYEAPKATFVPLKLEERLLGCRKTGGNPNCANAPSGS
ncbi:MAG: hypothetical protein NTV22_06760 [bacterium]|nr:hypothetical protein [bacterium]